MNIDVTAVARFDHLWGKYQSEVTAMTRKEKSPLNVVLPREHPRNVAIQAALAGAKPPGDLINHGGPVMTSVELISVYVGAAWKGLPLSGMRDDFNAFFDALLSSPYFDRLSIYGVGPGRRVGTQTTDDATPSTMTDDDLRAIVKRLTSGTIAPNANTLVALFTPPGTTIDATTIGAGKTCIDHCAYHDVAGGVAYAALPYFACAGCMSAGHPTDTFASMCRVASHEVCEAVTDPQLSAWYAADGEEIGDLCNGTETALGPYTVQKEWINGHGCS